MGKPTDLEAPIETLENALQDVAREVREDQAANNAKIVAMDHNDGGLGLQ